LVTKGSDPVRLQLPGGLTSGRPGRDSSGRARAADSPLSRTGSRLELLVRHCAPPVTGGVRTIDPVAS